MTLLEKINAGQQTITVSLWAFQQEKEQTICRTLDEAKELLHKQMAKGWAYRLNYASLDDKGDENCWENPEVAEVERALGLKPLSELV